MPDVVDEVAHPEVVIEGRGQELPWEFTLQDFFRQRE